MAHGSTVGGGHADGDDDMVVGDGGSFDSSSSIDGDEYNRLVPLRESRAVDGIVFDKMDFSGICHANGAVMENGGSRCGTQGPGNCVDLSYFQTKIPQSVVATSSRKRASGKDVETSDSRRRRR